MKNTKQENTEYSKLIANLQNDPDKIVFGKKVSVREAIIEIGKDLDQQVFTKKILKELIELRFPELKPVDIGNLGTSIDRASEYIECIRKDVQNIYRYKKTNNTK